MIRYLYFSLAHKTAERRNEVMISTFLKTTESKEVAAETVNFLDNKAAFGPDGRFRIEDFGAARYGHPLCFYTRSYMGESIYLTTRIMELDKVDPQVMKAVQGGIRTVASLPFFAEFLPYAAGAAVGVSLFQKLLDLFNKDDSIVEGHHLDLHFGLRNVRCLQSGRLVCVPGKEEPEILEQGEYTLSVDNRLVDVNKGKEYDEGSYFVIQVDARPCRRYEDFDYLAGAAELLRMTNRSAEPVEYVPALVEVFKGYNDIMAIHEIEDLALDMDDEHAREKVKAMFRSMSPAARRLYKDRVIALLGPAS